MASASAGDVGRHLRQLFGAGSGVGLTDGQLLERFATAGRDSAEAAFETILARHGSTVLSVCRQVLGDGHAAEDAFQATFLVLVRRADSLHVRDNGSLGAWLHGVAYRTALKARQEAARRRAREHRAARDGLAVATVDDAELGAALHAEVQRLPAKYRAPVVLCYFEGRTHDEAAAALDWPVGTVRSRLSRARDLLRSRLTRRGLAPAGLVATELLTPPVRAEVPAALREATVSAAVRCAAAAAAGELADPVFRGLLAARVRMAAAALVLLAMAAGLTVALIAATGLPRRPSPGRARAHVAAPRPQPASDDPLPAHARARLGTIRFHGGDSIGQVQYTPDGKFLVTLDATNVIHVWSADSGRIVREIGDPAIDFRTIALARDGKMLATAEYPSRLRLWDFATGRETRQWHEVKDENLLYTNFDNMAFSPDGRALAVGVRQYRTSTKTYEKWIDLRDTSGPTEYRRRIRADWLWLKGLAFAPDGRTLATASQDTQVDAKNQIVGPEKGSVRLWDLATGRQRQRFPVEGAFVQSLAISPDSASLAASVTDGTVRIYDLATDREREPRPGREPAAAGGGRPAFLDQPRAMNVLAFSPDGSILAGGTAGAAYRGDFSLAAIHLWDVARGRELRRIPAHQQCVASLSFSPDGRTLASTGVEPAIGFWDVATGREAVEQLGHRSAIRALAVSPKDGTVFTGGYDGTIRQWDPATGRELAIVARFDDPTDSWALGPDGQSLIVCARLGLTLVLWSIPERREVRGFPRGNQTVVHRVAWSPDGTTFAAEGRIWDVAAGRVRAICRTPDGKDAGLGAWFPIAYSPDGRTVIATGQKDLSVWDVASGKRVGAAIRMETLHTLAMALSPDGRVLASGGIVNRSRGREVVDPPIRLHELATGKEIATLQGPEATTLCLAFSPDGRLLASGSGDRWSAGDHTVRVWDVVTGRELRRFDGHRGMVNAIAFTPDGRSVVSGSEDATALVWDVSDLRDR